MSEQERNEIQERLSIIRKRILTMEWDKEHNQFNIGLQSRYDELKKEYEHYNAVLNRGQPSMQAEEPDTVIRPQEKGYSEELLDEDLEF